MKAEHNTVIVGLVSAIVGILLGIMIGELQEASNKSKLRGCHLAVDRLRVEAQLCDKALKKSKELEDALQDHLFLVIEGAAKVKDNRPIYWKGKRNGQATRQGDSGTNRPVSKEVPRD